MKLLALGIVTIGTIIFKSDQDLDYQRIVPPVVVSTPANIYSSSYYEPDWEDVIYYDRPTDQHPITFIDNDNYWLYGANHIMYYEYSSMSHCTPGSNAWNIDICVRR